MTKRRYYKKRPIIGPVEEVVLSRNSGKKKNALARIDTGADYSSIGENLAKNIGFKRIVKELQNLKHIITNPKKNHKPEQELLNSIKGVKGAILIRSAAGRTRRVLVPLNMELAGKNIRTKVTIIERTHMQYPMIVGRKDLQKGKFIIDPLRRR
jgi:hypothetical protein